MLEDKLGIDKFFDLQEYLVKKTKKLFNDNHLEFIGEIEGEKIPCEYAPGFIPYTEGGVVVDALLYALEETVYILERLGINDEVIQVLKKNQEEAREDLKKTFFKECKNNLPSKYANISQDEFYNKLFNENENVEIFEELYNDFATMEGELDINMAYRLRIAFQKNNNENGIYLYATLNTETDAYRSNEELRRELGGQLANPVEFLLGEAETRQISFKSVQKGIDELFEKAFPGINQQPEQAPA